MLDLRSAYINDDGTDGTAVLSTIEALDSTPPIGWDDMLDLSPINEES